MKRTYCDCCGEEITRQNKWDEKLPAEPHFTVKWKWKSEASICSADFRIQRFGDEMSSGDADICKYCILSAACKLDDRPAPESFTRRQVDEHIQGAGAMVINEITKAINDTDCKVLSLEALRQIVSRVTGCLP